MKPFKTIYMDVFAGPILSQSPYIPERLDFISTKELYFNIDKKEVKDLFLAVERYKKYKIFPDNYIVGKAIEDDQ